MKKTILTITTILWMTFSIFAQTNDFFIGPAFSFQSETRSKMIYGPGYEERNSKTDFFGIGIRMQKRFMNSWGLNFGANYIKRHYEMIVPFDHCHFSEPGVSCTKILAHVEKYGYNTIEIPLGINKYIISKEKWELYMNLNAVTAYDFQSFYISYIPKMETKKKREINHFSTSLTGTIGFAYKVTDKTKFIAEPFMRLAHKQRLDPILITGREKERTNFDNHGLHLLLLYRF
ncbi:hypothetical protein [Algoriphagus sp. NG3]|uniref:hypothetical protein n=1 Tax=Algoriphagus sp. NG3 TaxID=3097546 RepID=UPI002A7FC706|nr:hypothetical protein [Algoriphagus sp. NG3]WPR76488.1 hypothetical protein SLW71_03895 [Algoriphagus sp. NG3]